jgi:hypothetical protein
MATYSRTFAPIRRQKAAAYRQRQRVAAGTRLAIELRPHPTSPCHQIATVEYDGRLYALTYAEPFPTEAEIVQLWWDERRAFRPYDETTGRYLAQEGRP